MKSKKIIALGLALALGLGLAACGTKEVASGEETPSESPLVSQEPTDSATPMHSGTPTPEETPVPSNAPATAEPSQPVAATSEPSQSAAPTTAATPTPATATPAPSTPASATPTPEATPAAKAPTAKEVYDAVEKATGNSGYYDASSLVENFYNLSAGDLEEYRFAMPSMSSKLEETFVAKVKSGKLSAVKSACESRQQGLVEEAEEYPTTGDYVSGYQLVTEGDWILFYVGANAKKAVEAFQNSVK